ncbi:MAG: hypothetical protein NC205_05440 [Prevotella sp.]|nr:hypothetical protein [Alistipes senegalensis]MCM1358019.1 hypothetical protein [Prevotella sp.]MCM1473461.1 hypothetical protein [Muribaculaceae bacterium]
MNDTAEIREQNKALIMEIIRSGGEYTKQKISLETGLSVATCNTLLNVLAEEKRIIGDKRQLNNVGRNTMVYHINDDFESILCICFELLGGVRRIFTRIVSPSGKLISEKIKIVDHIGCEQLLNISLSAIEQYPNISCIIIGNPGIAENGTIHHCDVPELNGVNILKSFNDILKLPVNIENDMYFKAYGYYMSDKSTEKIITMMNFHSNVLPGTATIYKGTIIKGKNNFAGMVGFLPYGITAEQYLAKLNNDECIPLISNATASVIAVINPDKMVFTGNLLNSERIKEIYCECLKSIPEEYMPEFFFLDDFEKCYTMGMYHTAIKNISSYKQEVF